MCFKMHNKYISLLFIRKTQQTSQKNLKHTSVKDWVVAQEAYQ